jgi:hypothetical protein
MRGVVCVTNFSHQYLLLLMYKYIGEILPTYCGYHIGGGRKEGSASFVDEERP